MDSDRIVSSCSFDRDFRSPKPVTKISATLRKSLSFNRCYYVSLLVEGLASADDLARSIRPKILICSLLSILYDLPRIYLNVNLFGSLCSFYHNYIKKSVVITTLKDYDGICHK